MPTQDVRAVVLAGGSGTRLWPLSRLQAPKQFLPLLGEESLLEATVQRLVPMIDASNVIIVTNQETATGQGYHILRPYEKIVEPAPRNTAPAIGVAALRFALEGIDPVMVVLPSDHLIRDVAAFQASLAAAIEHARSGKLVMFGIPPTSPETGFGYIQAERGTGARAVRSFHEKPDRATAQSFLDSGDYFWNSGMFVWRASEILREIGTRLPELARVLDKIREDASAGGDLGAAIKRHFAAAPSISIDHGVLEKSDRLFMMAADFDWSDVGSWDAVYELADKDENANALLGNVVAIECRNTLIRSPAPGRRGGRRQRPGDRDSGCRARDAAHRQPERAQGGRRAARRSAPEHLLHATVQRPWGAYTVLEEGPNFKIKRIEVNPSGRLSLQSHKFRSEHWVVLEGTARVTCDARIFELGRNESTFVPIGARHRLENPGEVPLVIIEVQVGTSVDESDIVRYDDQYGR